MRLLYWRNELSFLKRLFACYPLALKGEPTKSKEEIGDPESNTSVDKLNGPKQVGDTGSPTTDGGNSEDKAATTDALSSSNCDAQTCIDRDLDMLHNLTLKRYCFKRQVTRDAEGLSSSLPDSFWSEHGDDDGADDSEGDSESSICNGKSHGTGSMGPPPPTTFPRLLARRRIDNSSEPVLSASSARRACRVGSIMDHSENFGQHETS